MKDVTEDDILKACKQVFKNMSSTPTPMPWDIKVYEEENMLSFKVGTLMTGVGGFLNLIKTQPIFRISAVWYNGRKLTPEGTLEFWERVDKDLNEIK